MASDLQRTIAILKPKSSPTINEELRKLFDTHDFVILDEFTRVATAKEIAELRIIGIAADALAGYTIDTCN